MFWFLSHEVCGILAPWPGIEPTPSALEGKVLISKPPKKSFLLMVFKKVNFTSKHAVCLLITILFPHISNDLQFSSVQLLSRVQLFATPWTAASQASLYISNSWSLPKPMSIESVMPSNYLILCHPLLLLPSILPSIRIPSNESALRIRWPLYWSFSFNISPSNEYSRLIFFRMD